LKPELLRAEAKQLRDRARAVADPTAARELHLEVSPPRPYIGEQLAQARAVEESVFQTFPARLRSDNINAAAPRIRGLPRVGWQLNIAVLPSTSAHIPPLGQASGPVRYRPSASPP